MPDLKKYGLTEWDWAMLLLHQQGRCPICDRRFTAKRRPVVDHDHQTGRVRGGLCQSCNTRLGVLHEDAGWLERAHIYLAFPIADTVFDTPRRHVNAPPEVTP